MITVSDSFSEVAGLLADFLKRNDVIFLRCDPEVVDFRKHYDGTLLLLGKGDGVRVRVPDRHFSSFAGLLAWGVFGGGKTLYTWDVKQLFSYIYHRWPRHALVNVQARVVDIKYGEAFLGLKDPCPQTWEEASRRGGAITASGDCWNVHQRIHIPLATRALPKVETAGLLDAEDRVVRHASYEIEGQRHGRLNCREEFPGGLLAHTLTEEDKRRLRPRLDNVFAVLDFKSMEVCVLQALSKDERLGKIISSGRDIYSTIYSLLYGSSKCTDGQRQFIKRIFLPVVYGLQVDSLSKFVGKAEAVDVVSKINTYFGVAMGWVGAYQDQARRGTVRDRVGRPRDYERAWVARNAAVQGPAAMVCLEKLIDLYDAVYRQCEVAATVHDGYVLDVQSRLSLDVVQKSVRVLEGESLILPGLKLRVGVKVGANLADVTSFPVDRSNTF